MPPAANRMMREFGIIAVPGCRRAAVGRRIRRYPGERQRIGRHGLRRDRHARAAAYGRIGLWLTRANYLSICGILAGSMTDPPALAFAQGMSGSEAPTLSYATVYPIVMVLRVVIPQFIALALWTV
jgi:putative transport protein